MIELPSGLDIKNLINDLTRFSWEASETLLYYAQILKDSKNKNDILENGNINDPVTLADLKVNEIIISKINEKYRNVNWKILSEENVKKIPFESDLNHDWVWVLDPLDGTKDFIQGTSNYAMHLALNYKNKPFIGLVLIPEKDELWVAYGKEVWCERRNGSKLKPSFSKTKDLKDMTLVTSKNHRNENLKNLIKKIEFKEVMIMGSIGCKVASILRGECDLYICMSLPNKSSPKDWDFAAPEAILKSSGGALTNLYNQELTYGKSNFEQGGIIVASNDVSQHKNLCLEIKDIITKYDLYPLHF